MGEEKKVTTDHLLITTSCVGCAREEMADINNPILGFSF